MGRRILLALAAAPLAALVFSAPAQATPEQDQQYFTLLREMGLEPDVNAVQSAYAVCQQVWSGVDPYSVAEQVYQANPINWEDAKNAVAASIIVYCPPVTDARKLYT